MKISYNWIKDYLKIDLDPHKVAEILTSVGLEIEGTEEWCSVKGGMEGIVIGEVLTSAKHPDADKLSVNTVNVGRGEALNIVCGAPNVAAGQKVPVALPGALVYKGEEKFEIKKSKIRGAVSEGMICAEDEIGLGTSHEGIMVLDQSAVPGTPAGEYFRIAKDFIFEIGLTPNRIDSGSHIGVARDLAAYLAINNGSTAVLTLPPVEDFKPDMSGKTFEIIIGNPEACPRYTGVNIYDVRIAESPDWLKNRLRAIGLNPINNVVDITNYIQFEIGQPLHSFDADKVTGGKVFIKNLPDKTKFVTLDGSERELNGKDLMICNQEEGMCIAGVFGGVKSGVTASTKNIFLESACFNPVSIRKTAKRHDLHTDASFRFERGTDPDIAAWALRRAAILIRDIAGGKLHSEIIDIYPGKKEPVKVDVTYHNIERLTGKKIPGDTIRKILDLLGFRIESETSEGLTLSVPSFKVDVSCEADVIEEILRIYGYNNVEVDLHVSSTLNYLSKPDRERVMNIVADTLTANGFAEIMCNSLVPSAWFENNEDFDARQLVMLANPLSSDLNAMRQTLLYGGLSSIAWNINRQRNDLRLYEFGNVYFHRPREKPGRKVDNYFEKTDLDLFVTGLWEKPSWNNPAVRTDFFRLKSYAEHVLARTGLAPESMQTSESGKKYYSESVTYMSGSVAIAEIGKLSRAVLRKFDIDQDVFYGHIEWEALLKAAKNNIIQYRELPKYPAVRRDLALLVDTAVKFRQISDLAFKTERNILKGVNLFDVYENESLGKNKKSYAVSFTLQDEQRTLTDKNIDRVMDNLIRIYEKDLGAQVRR
ncbi:MAG TPA: phenylalanine--tRNA ligase subunit beta [Bacteroidales bacterium]|nr:phenylalanine--tRNA ligase subunit beta [Bacteroidales bacterium]